MKSIVMLSCRRISLMKKHVHVKIILLVVLFLLACIPMHVYMSDGGSEGWYAILWQYTQFNGMDTDGWRVGPQITLFWFIPLYDGTYIQPIDLDP